MCKARRACLYADFYRYTRCTRHIGSVAQRTRRCAALHGSALEAFALARRYACLMSMGGCGDVRLPSGLRSMRLGVVMSSSVPTLGLFGDTPLRRARRAVFWGDVHAKRSEGGSGSASAGGLAPVLGGAAPAVGTPERWGSEQTLGDMRSLQKMGGGRSRLISSRLVTRAWRGK